MTRRTDPQQWYAMLQIVSANLPKQTFYLSFGERFVAEDYCGSEWAALVLWNEPGVVWC